MTTKTQELRQTRAIRNTSLTSESEQKTHLLGNHTHPYKSVVVRRRREKIFDSMKCTEEYNHGSDLFRSRVLTSDYSRLRLIEDLPVGRGIVTTVDSPTSVVPLVGENKRILDSSRSLLFVMFRLFVYKSNFTLHYVPSRL